MKKCKCIKTDYPSFMFQETNKIYQYEIGNLKDNYVPDAPTRYYIYDLNDSVFMCSVPIKNFTKYYIDLQVERKEKLNKIKKIAQSTRERRHRESSTIEKLHEAV